MSQKSKKVPLKATITIDDLADTEKLAFEIARALRGGEVIGLSGQLGAGKTTFVQALARALHIKEVVKSPTFTILQSYRGQRGLRLCHVDAYRLSGESDLAALGFFDHLTDARTVTIVEWAEKIKKSLPRTTIWLKFSLTPKKRRVSITT